MIRIWDTLYRKSVFDNRCLSLQRKSYIRTWKSKLRRSSSCKTYLLVLVSLNKTRRKTKIQIENGHLFSYPQPFCTCVVKWWVNVAPLRNAARNSRNFYKFSNQLRSPGFIRKITDSCRTIAKEITTVCNTARNTFRNITDTVTDKKRVKPKVFCLS